MTAVRMGPRPLVGMVLGWLAVVVAVAAITFVVVDRAGRGVGQASAAETVAVLPPPTTPPTASAPTPRDTASFTSDGGTVVASCTDGQVELVSIRPRDGWRFEKESEHGGLEVAFRGDGQQVELLLRCVDGVPTSVQEG